MVGGRQLGARILRLYLPLGFFLVAMLFPFYWMAITSIKPNRELYNPRIMPLIVHQPVLKHYVDLLDQTNFLTWTYNTMRSEEHTSELQSLTNLVCRLLLEKKN